LHYGPVIASVTGGSENFKHYKSGLIDKCEPGLKVNHAVLIVGYGTEVIDDLHVDYFIIKNSFGTQWGERGFARISAAPTNVCGILSDVFFPKYPDPDHKKTFHSESI